MSPEALYLAMAGAVLGALAVVLCVRILAKRLRAELRVQSSALASGLQAAIDARVLAAVRDVVDRELTALREEHAADARSLRQEFGSRQLAWRTQLDAELLSMRLATGRQAPKNVSPTQSHALPTPTPTPTPTPMERPDVLMRATRPAAAAGPTLSARPPEMRHTPIPRAQASVDPPAARRELSDEELDALPPELPGPTRSRRALPAPKKPPFRSL